MNLFWSYGMLQAKGNAHKPIWNMCEYGKMQLYGRRIEGKNMA